MRFSDFRKKVENYQEILILALGLLMLVLLREVVQETISRLIFFSFFTSLAFRIDYRIPMIVGILLLLASALIITISEDFANSFSIYAYYFLFIGIVLKLFKNIKKKEKGEELKQVIKTVFEVGNSMPRIIAIASGKGGVGKTTIVANLGTALVKLGYDVLLIDMDLAMPNLEIITGLRNPSVGLVDVLEGKLELDRVVYTGHLGTQVIPSGIILDGYSTENVEKIKKLLLDFPIKCDFVILDLPTGREALSVLNDMIEVLLVVNPNKPALLDALNMKVLLEKKGVNVIGAVLNRAHRKDEEWIDNTEKILETHVIAVIHESTVVNESMHNEDCFVASAAKSVPSKEIMALAKEIAI